jgi:predicted ribosome quality control (RQC) complex YloA/Tae2 family protein
VNNAELEAVTLEFQKQLVGRRFGRVFPLGRRSFAVDLRLPDSRYLFVAAEPAAPRTYLIKRRLKDLDKTAENPQPFHLLLKKHLAALEVAAVEKFSNDRVLSVRFTGTNEVGEAVRASIVIQLTGKSSNVFLLNDHQQIIGSLIEKDIDGQRIGESYTLPERTGKPQADEAISPLELHPEDKASVSAALDRVHTAREALARFTSKAANARRDLEREIAKRQKLVGRLQADLKQHGDAERWKRFGDLLLANLSSAERRGSGVIVTDFFDETAPQIEIQVNENDSLTEAAQKFFKLYSKAQTASVEIEKRIQTVTAELHELELKRQRLDEAIAQMDESFFDRGEAANKPLRPAKKEKHRFSGAREFKSSDGFDILVGKRAIDNDQLTFRVAASLDTWLHAADYPGSHVIIRNPNRKEIPPRTLLEAAQLAAFYSSGKTQPKAAVHYTQKKFVNKPKGAAPGLVRLASFKTIMVEPAIPAALDQKAK